MNNAVNMSMNMNMNMNMNKSQNMPAMDRCSLMKKIYEVGFSMDDTILFLDTHPKDREALDYYHQLKKEYDELVKKYTIYFGPLTARDVNDDMFFTWVNRPMPWEGDV